MCSISGLVWDAPRPVLDTLQAVRTMNRSLRHRGPDGEGAGVVRASGSIATMRWTGTGEYVEGSIGSDGLSQVGLGMNRLAIRDVAAGHQPMVDSSGRVMIVFNGEIYNCDEVEADLGPSFRPKTRCDTEIILLAYLKWGQACVERLAGMFAFAIWDGRDESLFIARDRLGIKPLVWAKSGGALLFGSELRSLLATGLVERRVRSAAIVRYLSHLYVPPPEGPFEDVFILEPAHTLTWKAGETTLRRYWTAPFGVPSPDRSLKEHIERFRTLFERAVQSHLVSEVPIGAFLSGGIDSTVVVALMRQLGAEAVKTYTIGFDADAFDESKDAARSAKTFHTDHHEFQLKLADLEDSIVSALTHYDQPFADPSGVPTYVLCRETAKHVKVALAGDGSDEQLAGYPRSRQYVFLEALRRAPRPLRSLLGRLAKSAAPLLGRRAKQANNLAGYTRLLESTSANDRMIGYIQLRDLFRNGWRERLLSPAFATSVARVDTSSHLHSLAERSRATDPLTAVLEAEVLSYLPNDILQKVDTASGAHGLEVRVPFLDHRLVEAVAMMPPSAKWRPGESKVVLRRAFDSLLPAHTRAKRKQGFQVPVADWFRAKGRSLLNDVLLTPRARQRGYFDPAAVELMASEHLEGRRDNGNMLWALLQLELWHRTYVDT